MLRLTLIRFDNRFLYLFPSLLSILARELVVLGKVDSSRFEHVLIIDAILAIVNAVPIGPAWSDSWGVIR